MNGYFLFSFEQGAESHLEKPFRAREGLLKIRGEIKKSDAVAALLATKAVQGMVAVPWKLWDVWVTGF